MKEAEFRILERGGISSVLRTRVYLDKIFKLQIFSQRDIADGGRADYFPVYGALKWATSQANVVSFENLLERLQVKEISVGNSRWNSMYSISEHAEIHFSTLPTPTRSCLAALWV